MAVFGNTNMEEGIDSVCAEGVQNVCGSPFYVGESGYAESITVGLSAEVVLEQFSIKCAIYDADGNFIAETEERTGLSFGDAGRWETFNFPTPVYFTPGTYYLVVFGKATKYQQFDLYIRITPAGAIDTEEYTKKEATYPNFPDTIPQAFLLNRASIYCTYTPAPPPVARRFQGDGLTLIAT